MSDRAYGGSHLEWMEYFYALATRHEENVPEAAALHVRECAFCREQVVRLKKIVSGTRSGKDERGEASNRATIDSLDSHFHLLGEKVTCSRARPFLPGLLDSSLDLRIPTPVTVHVDQCPQCAGDLKRLRELNLDAGQLKRLRWLYEHGATGGSSLCRRARHHIDSFIHGAWRDIDGEILNHLSQCPRCRADVYVRRQSLLDRLPEASDDRCGHVAPAELFDHVVPHADRVDGVEFSAASPGALCRERLEMMQTMHRIVYGIDERAESAVATVCRMAENDRTTGAGPGDPYADCGVAVEIVRDGSQQTRPRAQAAPKPAAARLLMRRILKAGAVAAAAILLAALFHYTHDSSGITMAKVVRAFGQARNVRVMSVSPEGDKVIYELWVSRDLNLTGLLTPQQCVIYDLANGEKEDVVSGTVAPIEDSELAGVRGMGDHCLGFSLSGIPTDAAWDRIDIGGNREVHEFLWMRQTDSGCDLPTKYEVTIDTSTMRPVSVRLFRIMPLETEWECQSLIMFEYPTEVRMRSVMMGEPLARDDFR